MTRGERLAKLEALLERVRARSHEPRGSNGVRPGAGFAPAAAASALPASAPAVEPVRSPPIQPSPVHAEPPQPAPQPTPLAARAEAPLSAGSLASEPEISIEVEVVSVHETGAPGAFQEEAPISDGLDSRERLVAAQPVPLDAPLASEGQESPPELVAAAPSASAGPSVGEGPTLDSAPPVEMVEVDVVAEEEDEEPPVSSQRPVVGAEPEERLAQMAFGTDEPPPLHTPPPESGRLPAAPEFDRDVTGVRSAAQLAARGESEQPAAAMRELVPEVTRSEVAPSDAVADWVAEAQRFAPSTFVALLDASLAL